MCTTTATWAATSLAAATPGFRPIVHLKQGSKLEWNDSKQMYDIIPSPWQEFDATRIESVTPCYRTYESNGGTAVRRDYVLGFKIHVDGSEPNPIQIGLVSSDEQNDDSKLTEISKYPNNGKSGYFDGYLYTYFKVDDLSDIILVLKDSAGNTYKKDYSGVYRTSEYTRTKISNVEDYDSIFRDISTGKVIEEKDIKFPYYQLLVGIAL